MRALFCCVLMAASIVASSGFVFLTPPLRWPAGNVPMDLQLDGSARQPPLLTDGKTSWDDVAREALDNWNGVLFGIQFTEFFASGHGDGNGRNEVFFSPNVFGHGFGQDVLAITTVWRVGNRRVEGDTIFNSRDFVWDSYRGPLHGTIDLRRVALHEFGHTVGLDHPDQAHQVVVAQMNSVISDLDTLAEDDIKGAHALYPPPNARYSLNVSVNPSIAGRVIVRPAAPSGGYAPGTLISVTPKPMRGFRFNYWLVNNEPGPTRAMRFRIYDNTDLTAVFATNTAPRLRVQPRSRLSAQGNSVSFFATPAGRGFISYQWMHDGEIIEAATNRILMLSQVMSEDAGLYCVMVGNRRAETCSRPARLIVNN